MQCPACKDVTLSMADRQGVEVDYCPKCRGVWLDRGELDKIIERSAGEMPGPRPVPPDPRVYDRRDHDDDHRGHGKYRKKRGFLSEIFDFD